MIEQDYLAYKDELVNHIRKIVGDDAEDIVQEAFVNFLKRGKRTGDQPRALLFKITRDLAINRIKERNRHAEVVDPETFDTLLAPEMDPAKATEPDGLTAALTQMAANDAELLRLAYWEGLTQVAVSKRLGLPYERVFKRTKRAVKRLKKILEKSHFSCPA